MAATITAIQGTTSPAFAATRSAELAVETHYARNGEINIAYQVVGSGPRDLIFMMGRITHLDILWEEPRLARFLRRLASFSRLIVIDRRGTGLSDRVPPEDLPALEGNVEDIRAVMDDAGSAQAVMFGFSSAAPICALFASTYPERTSGLVICSGYAKRTWSLDYPWGLKPDEHDAFYELVEREWGGVIDLNLLAPSVAGDQAFRDWWSSLLRHGASPGVALGLARINAQIDIRHVLPAVTAPALVLHRTGDLACPVENARYFAEHIPGARLVELPGIDHLPFVGDQDELLDEVEYFMTGERPAPMADRLLTTLVVTEIVGGAEAALRLGDERWGEVRQSFNESAQHELITHHGQWSSPLLDGHLTSFDSPARAVQFARAVVAGARRLEISARAGLHTGEVVVVGGEVAGVAVYLTVRIAGLAGPGEVLVSSTVRDLVTDSEMVFEPAGDQVLPNLPGTWRLFKLSGASDEDAPRRSVSGEERRPASLSGREREIAKLVALGLTNRQIADELAISVATVERHVANILIKLEYRSRAQVAAWAVEQGLLQALT